MFVALVVAAPAAGFVDHAAVQHLDQLRVLRGRQQLALDHRQGEHRFAEGIGCRRADFQDREVIADQRVQASFGLVIGGVCFEHDARLLFDEGRQVRGGGRVVVVHAAVVEIHAGLHHHRDHALPGGQQVRGGKCFAVDGQGGGRGRRRRHLQATGQRGLTAGNRHFGADHVDRRRQPVLGSGALGNPRQFGRARRDDGVRQRRGVIGAGHAAVQVDLVETGGHIGGDQLAGVGHCGRCGAFLPGIRTEVVAAEHQPLGREARIARQLQHVVAVLRWGHTGIAAELIDLVGGRLDQQQGVVTLRHLHRRQQHLRVAAADAVQPDGGALAMGGDQRLDGGHGNSSNSGVQGEGWC